MPSLIQLRRGTDEEWEAANPILAEGEPAFNVTTSDIRIGDGTTRWLSLRPFRIEDGKSAYDLALENGYTGTEQEWIDFIQNTAVDAAAQAAVSETNVLATLAVLTAALDANTAAIAALTAAVLQEHPV